MSIILHYRLVENSNWPGPYYMMSINQLISLYFSKILAIMYKPTIIGVESYLFFHYDVSSEKYM